MAVDLYNEQTLRNTRVSIGTCKILMDNYVTPTAPGVSPTTELGFADNVTFTATADHVEMFNGSPQMLEDVFVGKESGMIEMDCDEHFYQQYCRVYSTGLCNTSGDGAMSGGGVIETNKVMIQLQHTLALGNVMNINVWRAIGAGVLPLSFSKSGTATDRNRYKLSFKMMKQQTVGGLISDWGNSELNRGEYMFKITF